ncbi:flagellar motor stator protein MotA [Aquisalimonas sp. 2447]|uniref:flagellar motor stator protein MotA n=1 Tax=Aquisalimonas sp. 2447 TaxID=2740807 RepID=UPI00143251B7|nr:flagellar motor stator protein MotA [Aquisalimonas sp. 2447]QIT55308.1 flagellar motor stator protein MotA [Aquisalimonas sp. 2447]
MLIVLGALIVVFSVITGYVAHGGQVAILWQPYEVLIIAGAAFGAFMISNPGKVIRQVFKTVPSLFKGTVYSKSIYMDLLAMLYELFYKAQREGLLAIEADVDDPHNSELFQKYPKVLAQEEAMTFLVDYLRLMVGGSMNPHELENLMDLELETLHQEEEMPAHAVNSVADALPGFGIIAALLGITIAMGEIDGPVDLIGELVAAALIGTFLGILSGYSFIGPLGKAMEHRARERAKFLEIIKVTIMAILNGYKPVLAVEFGRKVMYENERPSFQELEDHVKGK